MDSHNENIILNDLCASVTPTQATDAQLNNAANAAIKTDSEYDRRNNMYTDLLSQYIDKYKHKEKDKKIYKWIFFIIVMLAMAAVITVCLIVVVSLTIKAESTSLADFAVVLTSIGGIISTIVIIPKIIAEYLFPSDEESNMIDLVKNMQQNDTNIMDILNKKG